MATSRRFVQITNKEINKIKITCEKNTKTIIRLRLGDFREIFPDNHLAFGE